MRQPTLETARLLLRPFTLADAPAVEQLASAWQVADTTLNIPHPYPPGAAEQWIATHQPSFDAGTGVNFAIVLRTNSVVCGSISMGITGAHRRAELGYWIGVPYWGHGYCSEAARVVVQYGFQELDLHRIYAQHFARNPASGRVMQKIGMISEGCLRQHVRKGDRFEDLMQYGILADEWRARQPR